MNQRNQVSGVERLGQNMAQHCRRGWNRFGRSGREYYQGPGIAQLDCQFGQSPPIVPIGKMHIEDQQRRHRARQMVHCLGNTRTGNDGIRSRVSQRFGNIERDQGVIFNHQCMAKRTPSLRRRCLVVAMICVSQSPASAFSINADLVIQTQKMSLSFHNKRQHAMKSQRLVVNDIGLVDCAVDRLGNRVHPLIVFENPSDFTPRRAIFAYGVAADIFDHHERQLAGHAR